MHSLGGWRGWVSPVLPILPIAPVSPVSYRRIISFIITLFIFTPPTHYLPHFQLARLCINCLNCLKPQSNSAAPPPKRRERKKHQKNPKKNRNTLAHHTSSSLPLLRPNSPTPNCRTVSDLALPDVSSALPHRTVLALTPARRHRVSPLSHYSHGAPSHASEKPAPPSAEQCTTPKGSHRKSTTKK